MKKNKLFKPKVLIKMKNLNWPQSKARFPFLNPKGDADNDGVKNFRDCKPFDIKRQGDKHDEEMAIGFEYIKSLKTVGDVQELEKSFLKKVKR